MRVFLSDRPWADGEVYGDGAGRLVWSTVPARALLQDVPAVATALIAVHDAEFCCDGKQKLRPR